MKTETQTEKFKDLSFDGCGINGRDEYRTRIATFSNDADKYGKLFAAAPELLEALKEVIPTLERAYELRGTANKFNPERCHLRIALAAIAKATGGNL